MVLSSCFLSFLASISHLSRKNSDVFQFLAECGVPDAVFRDGEGRCGRYCLLLEIS